MAAPAGQQAQQQVQAQAQQAQTLQQPVPGAIMTSASVFHFQGVQPAAAG